MAARLTLTFDNGPTVGVTDRVLDVLRERQLPATFFVVGQRLDAPGTRALTERAHAEGHAIGNHSFTHRTALGELSADADVDREIDETERRLAALRHPDRLFRPFGNGGVIDDRLLGPHGTRRMLDGGFTCVLWTSVPHDWDDPDGWVDTARRQLDDDEHAVVVLHDYDTGGMRHLERFLDDVLADGTHVTADLPDACVPIRRGVPTASFALLSHPRPNR